MPKGRDEEVRIQAQALRHRFRPGWHSPCPRWCSCWCWCCSSWPATWRRWCSRGRGRARRSWPFGPRSAPPAAASSGSCLSKSLLLGSIAAVHRHRPLRRSHAQCDRRGVPRAGRSGSRFEPNPASWRSSWRSRCWSAPVSGLLPALRVTRHDLRNTLQAGRGFAFGGFGKVGAVLLVVEIALVGRAVERRRHDGARLRSGLVDEIPALPKNQVLTAHLGRIDSPEMRDQIIEAAAQMPGVVAAGAGATVAAAVSGAAADGGRGGRRMSRSDAPRLAPSFAGGQRVPRGDWRARTGRGRVFTAADYIEGAAPVAVVNEPFVQKFLGGRNPLGRRIRIDDGGANGDASSHGARSSASCRILA